MLGQIFQDYDDYRKHHVYRRNPDAAVLYVIEIDATRTKIGRTENPRSRIGQHAHAVAQLCETNVGRIYISPPHTDSLQTEHAAHSRFLDRRIKGEFFRIPFMAGVNHVESLSFSDEPPKPVDIEWLTRPFKEPCLPADVFHQDRIIAITATLIELRRNALILQHKQDELLAELRECIERLPEAEREQIASLGLNAIIS